jgi:hypothetical protein
LKTEAIVHHQPSHCLNCGAHAPASFCQHCGQETEAHVPGAGEYLHEFIGHYVALESKLWKTLALLLFKPGRLTRDYIEGKRVRYVLPLRLYLTLSLIFFAAYKYHDAHQDHETEAAEPKAHAEQQVDHAARVKDLDKTKADLEARKESAGPLGAAVIAAGQAAIDEEKQKQEARATTAPAKAGASAPKASGQRRAKVGDDGADDKKNEFNFRLFSKESFRDFVHGISPKLTSRLDKFNGLSDAEQEHMVKAGFFAWLPYAIFAMMPIFALYLKLLYLGSGRRYGEHLLFALHTNAFAFLVLTLLMLLPGIPYVPKALGLWLVFYLPTAMRKVYGGSRKATFLRWIVLMGLHMLGMLVAMVAAFALAILG